MSKEKLKSHSYTNFSEGLNIKGFQIILDERLSVYHIQEDNKYLHQLFSELDLRPTVFTRPSILFYENQTPVTAIVLAKGKITLSKNKKTKKILDASCIIGLDELLEHYSANYSATAAENSEIFYLDRSTILEILEYNQDMLEGPHLEILQKLQNVIHKHSQMA